MAKRKVIIAGGGTGGHIFPALAIAEQLEKEYEDLEILFVGALGRMEMERIPKAGYEIVGLPIAGMNRSQLWKNWNLPFKIWKSNSIASKLVKEFQPDIAIGVGGYASYPLLKMAQANGVPTLIQEQNSFAGKTNKILGKKAASICVAYENMEKFFPKDKITITGNPIREQIKKLTKNKLEALDSFGLSIEKKTIAIVGGSLGAKSVNEAVAKYIEQWVEEGFQVIWQTGKNFEIEEKYLQLPGVIVRTFFDQIEDLYVAADVIISRAGALACAELALIGKPVIFVPFPFAAENHQYENAKAFEEKGAALLIKDAEVKEKLNETLHQLLENEQKMEEMGGQMKTMAMPNAEEQIVEIIKNIIK